MHSYLVAWYFLLLNLCGSWSPGHWFTLCDVLREVYIYVIWANLLSGSSHLVMHSCLYAGDWSIATQIPCCNSICNVVICVYKNFCVIMSHSLRVQAASFGWCCWGFRGHILFTLSCCWWCLSGSTSWTDIFHGSLKVSSIVATDLISIIVCKPWTCTWIRSIHRSMWNGDNFLLSLKIFFYINGIRKICSLGAICFANWM